MLASLAAKTLRIVDTGRYRTDAGREVDIAAAVRAAIDGTRLYAPDDVDGLVADAAPGAHATRIEVTPERTAAAGQRLARECRRASECQPYSE